MPIDLPERFGRLDAADPPLRLPQEPHRGAQQARAQPRRCCTASWSANPHTAFTHFNLGTEYVGDGRHRDRAASTSSEALRLLREEHGWCEIALRLAARHAPDRRAPRDRRHRRRRRAGRTSCSGLPDVHRPRLRARPGRPASAATSTGARRRCSSAAWRWATRPPRFSGMVGRGSFLALGRAGQRRRRTAATATRPRAWSSGRSSGTPAYLPAGLELADPAAVAADDADPDAVLERLEAYAQRRS